MKIIKEGDFDRSRWPLTFKCEQCGCEFEASYDEYSEERGWDQHTLGWRMFHTCHCPCCGYEVIR